MEEQSILFSKEICAALAQTLKATKHDRLFVLTDETTRNKCLPLLCRCAGTSEAELITVKPGDANKNVESLLHVWKSLSQGKASRHSLLINLGGGMVTDLGGFAASTFKRGIRFINIPTTLLAMVDASVGGKTGINLDGLKNEVGTFRNASEVIIDTDFLYSLDKENLRSGFAEMLKHGLISNRRDWAELLQFDLMHPDLPILQELIKKSVDVKKRIVGKDPEEHGIRKALNFGHTAGHAIESLSIIGKHPVLHGYAVAWGIVCELYLCCKRLQFPHDVMLQTVQFIKQNYGVFTFNCKDYEKLYKLMTHDKKNTEDIINFTLLSDIGRIHIDQRTSKDEIFEMLDFYRETMGC